jgi:hypothetical protein
MRPLLFVAVVAIAVLLVWLISEATEDSVESDSVRVIATWGREKPDYVVAADMFTTTTTARPRSAPKPRTTVRAASVSAGVPDEVWDRIAQCESGGNWQDTRGGYEGGLHFHPDTWVRAGGTRYAPHAYQATRRQQIDIANEWLARTSWAQWPVCSRKVGVR